MPAELKIREQDCAPFPAESKAELSRATWDKAMALNCPTSLPMESRTGVCVMQHPWTFTFSDLLERRGCWLFRKQWKGRMNQSHLYASGQEAHELSFKALHHMSASLMLLFWPSGRPALLHTLPCFQPASGPRLFLCAQNARPRELLRVGSSSFQAWVIADTGQTWLPHLKMALTLQAQLIVLPCSVAFVHLALSDIIYFRCSFPHV